MKRSELDNELSVAAIVMIACGILTVIAGVNGKYALSGLLGDKPELLPQLTRVAMNAAWWIPPLYLTLFVVLCISRLRYPNRRWVTVFVLGVVAISAAFIAYGITLPFANMGFEMSHG